VWKYFPQGGTLKALNAAKVPAKSVETLTGFPEVFEGRVKTLHPKIHGGLLYRRKKEAHLAEAKKHGIDPIDLVIVNLYPFEEVIRKPDVDLEMAIENIDIGGPSMLRSAAKNYESVTVVCDPEDYDGVVAELKQHRGGISEIFRKQLALKVFEKTGAYDQAIADYLGAQNGCKQEEEKKVSLPPHMDDVYVKTFDLRYGENPHQQAAFYVPQKAKEKATFKQLHGKELSFNNLLDIEGIIAVMQEFEQPTACVVKHTNPCGVAEGAHTAEALENAIECDSMSAFGGILGINRSCNVPTAQVALDRLRFFEVFVAPSFQPAALRRLKKRKNLRLIETNALEKRSPYDLRFLQNGVLMQTRDLPIRDQADALKENLKIVTKVKLNDAEIEGLLFAFKCVKVVKSNAIVITQGRQTVGIGAGQMSRIDAVEIACRKAGYRTDGGVLASDAFFPMADSIEVARDYKIRAIIQPGGSVRDEDVITACNKFGIAMAFTGKRHFRH